MNVEFESDVWSELILCVLNTIKTSEGEEVHEYQVLHNVASVFVCNYKESCKRMYKL